MDIIETPADWEAKRPPWKTWTDGKVREAVEGVDLPSIRTFRRAGYTWASRHGMRLESRVFSDDSDGQLKIHFRFVRKAVL